VQFTASADMYEKLRLAQALLRHQIPDGDPAAIFDRALTALLQDLAKQRFAATDRPRGSRGTASGSRHIPAEVKRAVWIRDGGRCAFVSNKGRRCTEQGFLEFHHVAPHDAGGEPTADNIQLRCRAHNGYEAERYFGPRNPAVVRETRASYSVRTEFALGRSAAHGDQGLEYS
jgi:5-methylcytosine-specific restriction endonuclease McrA